MSEREKRSLQQSLQALAQKLNQAGRNTESAFERLEQRLDGAAKRADEKLAQFEEKMDQKTQQLDRFLEETEQRLEVILRADHLKKHFEVKRAHGKTIGSKIRAVDGVALDLVRGETLGIVGESGCGKSTIARVLIGLIPPSEGSIQLFGKDFAVCSKAEQKAIRRRTGIVFQDPYGSLDPRMNVADIVSEPLRAYQLYPDKTERLLHTLEILEACGMSADDLYKFPHQFSGGQRQRICIARALVANPDIVVCDEAVSALDVSIQAQIINLLCDLRDARGLTYLFISHDLDVVRFIADRIAVMYLGKVVELAPKEALFSQPLHPYTQALLESAPVYGRCLADMMERAEPEELLFAAENAKGCRYLPRCKAPLPVCAETEPQLTTVAPGHAVACHRCIGCQGEMNG